MGDPKRQKKKYKTPGHPWQRARIEQEAEFRKTYGFRRKQEIWKVTSILRTFAKEAKRLNSLDETKSQTERSNLMKKVKRYGLLNEQGTIDDILSIHPRALMERRLQTLLVRKHMANSIRQARQFIAHRHVTVKGVKITSPNYLVPIDDETTIAFSGNSALKNNDHPARIPPKKQKKGEEKIIKKTADELEAEKVATIAKLKAVEELAA